jgi:RNA polymerase sigma-70 factor, ECF subfamily
MRFFMPLTQDSSAKVVELWTPIREKAYWTVLGIISDRHLAEDIMQEALITAIDKFHTLKDESKFESWFITISIRKAYHHLSLNKTFTLDEDAGLLYDEVGVNDMKDYYVDETYSQTRYTDMIERILSTLQTDSRRFLFYLRYVEDKPISEISTITGLKEGTLKSIFSRIRKDLSKMMGEEH